METSDRFMRDYTGGLKCRACWDGHHYHRVRVGARKGKLIVDCEGPPCECKCRELLQEKHPRLKRDLSAQMELPEETITVD